MENVLNVSNLRVELGGKSLFGGLSFRVKEGQTLAILGPNGAGKTVLLRTLLGFHKHRGEIRWKPGVRIGYVPQRVPLNKDLPVTVRDFFALKAQAVRDVSEALRRVGLSARGFADRQLGLLSSGQFQRVLIAWALANRPDVLLFDEPLAGVDAGGEETIYSLLKKIQTRSRLAILLVTHDLQIVPSLTDNALCLGGQNFCYGPVREKITTRVLRGIYGKDNKFFRHVHD